MTSAEDAGHDSARRRAVLDAFDAALDVEPSARQAWLIERFGGDPLLVRGVEALLAADAVAPAALPTDPGAPEAPPLIPPERIQAYRLVESLGGGGMGEVWLGRRDDGLFEHEVAIKLMRPSARASRALAFFNTERQVLARLRHPHIARLFDGGVTADGVPWILMERVDGVTLDAYIALQQPARDDLLRLLIKVAEAVQYAHQNLVVHADLKPSNILVTPQGEPSLVDFGVSSLAGCGSDDGDFPRTPAYASPQRMSGQPPVVGDDIYALGLLLRDVSGPEAPADIRAIAAKATAAAAEDRYATVQALAEDLKAFLAFRPVRARPQNLAYAAPLFVRRHRWGVAAAAAAVAATLAALAIITVLYLRSEARFEEVRALANYMLGDLNDDLERLPGGAALRVESAQVGRDYLERLSHVPGAPDDLKRDVAIGYGRIGHALGVTSTNATGDAGAGQQALAKSGAGLRDLLRRHPGDATIRRELARTLTWTAGVLGSTGGDGQRAYADLKEAIALYDSVLKDKPGDLEAAYGRWNAMNGLADAFYSDGRYAESGTTAARAATEGANLPDNGPWRALKALMQAADQNAMGDAAWSTDRAAAMLRYRKAVAILEAARSAGLMDVRIQQRLALYDYQVASGAQELGQLQDALAAVDHGTAVTEDLAAIDDSVLTRRLESLLMEARTGILNDLGRRSEAMANAGRPIELRRRQVTLHPENMDMRVGLASALRLYADLLDQWKRPQEACAALREAQAQWQIVAAHGALNQRLKDNETIPLAQRLKTCPAPAG